MIEKKEKKKKKSTAQVVGSPSTNRPSEIDGLEK